MDMAHRLLLVRIEQFAVDAVSAQGLESQRRQEPGSGGGHHHPDLAALLAQQAQQFRRFISCDTTANPQ